MSSRLIALPIACLALSTLAACGSSSSGGTASDAGASPTTVSCAYPSDHMSPAKPATAPSAQATKQGLVTVTISTSAVALTATLDSDAAPCTVNSFLSLAKQGYFDHTPCHRLVPGFVLQCGDPSGTGGGGPGYSFADELTGSEKYTRGVLAMANAGPNTNGSQFFIMLADAAGMPASYTVFGSIDAAGMKVVDAIASKGTKGGVPDGPPAQPVTITKIG